MKTANSKKIVFDTGKNWTYNKQFLLLHCEGWLVDWLRHQLDFEVFYLEEEIYFLFFNHFVEHERHKKTKTVGLALLTLHSMNLYIVLLYTRANQDFSTKFLHDKQYHSGHSEYTCGLLNCS